MQRVSEFRRLRGVFSSFSFGIANRRPRGIGCEEDAERRSMVARLIARWDILHGHDISAIFVGDATQRDRETRYKGETKRKEREKKRETIARRIIAECLPSRDRPLCHRRRAEANERGCQ